MKINYLVAGLLATLLFTSCKDEYEPPLINTDTNILVVEGVLNASGGSTNVRLSRSTKIDNFNNIVAEEGAQVTVEGETGPAQSLVPTGGGFYRGVLALTTGGKYRVRIVTTNGKEYLSAYSTVKQTPVIDSIGWSRSGDGVMVHANAHDATGNTTYYRWEYEETWEIHSYYGSKFIYENGSVRDRIYPDEERMVCWKHANSTSILIGSSAKLDGDRISQAPLVFIPSGHEKLAWRYSIIVRQYALEKNAYEFYDLMKKNTESIGTIFDPQPSEIRGNFTCVSDPEEPVIGHITASTVEEQRIFINSSQVPGWVFVENCPVQHVTPDSVVYYFEGDGFIPYDVKEAGNTVEYYLASYAGCVDCTKRGGGRQRPSFW